MKIFDLHCDTLLTGTSFVGNNSSVNLDRLPKNAQYCQCFAIFIRDGLPKYLINQQVKNYYLHFCSQLKAFKERIRQCYSTSDINNAFANNQVAAILTIENGAALIGKIDNLFTLAQHGVKAIGLTWNGQNQIGGGVHSSSGLTNFGRSVIGQMERLNIIVDVSHLNDQTFWQVASFAQRPIMASHSNSRSICRHKRNLTDQQFKYLVQHEGICGLNFCTSMLYDSKYKKNYSKQNNYDIILRHIDHFLELGGENTLALGSDFDGCTTLSCLQTTKDFGGLYDYLCKTGYGKNLVNKIFFDNALRFFKKFDN